MDYPVVGYHNWKETHYLTESRNFAEEGFFEHGFFVPAKDYAWVTDDPTGAHTDSFPTTSVILGFLFNIFGSSLFLARFVNILFALGSIVLVYSLVRKLFKRQDLALISAFLLAINPLNIFFGRQVQLIGPALFFCLLGLYFYIKYIHNINWKNTILFSFFMMLGVLTKYPFVLFAVPIVFTYPYKKILKKKYMYKHLFIALIGFLSFLWVQYISKISQSVSAQAGLLNPGVLFNSQFWKIIYVYILDNYTLIGFILFLLGLVLWFFVVKVNKKSFGYRFITWYFVGSLVWFIFMAEKLQGHNYHQYPLLLLFVFFVSFSILSISNLICKLIKNKNIKWVFILILVILVLVPSIDSKDRMFDTQFIGLDVAGEYIRDNSGPHERIIHSGHQDYGVIWHANRKAIDGGIPDVENIKLAEETLDVNWIFIYQWGMDVFNEPKWKYISDHYSLKQIAIQQTQEGGVPFYFLLKKGGSFNVDELNSLLEGKQPLSKEYEYTKGSVNLLYFNL
jgi:hypothetical protein